MIKGVEAARQDGGTYSATAIKREDRSGKPYYWIGGERAEVDARQDSDLNVVKRRCVSICPVQLDFTAHHEIEPLKQRLKDENFLSVGLRRLPGHRKGYGGKVIRNA